VPKLARPEHHQRLADLAPMLQFDDPINIQFTSGTTGSPKGATLTHHSILNNAFLTGERLGFTEKIGSACRCALSLLRHGGGGPELHDACAAMVFPAETFDPLSTMEALAHEKCTALYGVPTMLSPCCRIRNSNVLIFRAYAPASWQARPGPIEVMRQAITDMHLPQVTIAFGMTETSPVITQTAIHDSVARRVSTVGTVFPHTEVKIVDPDNRIVPIATPGELCARGFLVMRGYWNDPERTDEAIDRGRWMHTGDLATMDADGYCNIVGRIRTW